MSLPGVRLPSLLDPKPFERNLDRWINWDDLHRNVESEEVAVVGTVATAARTGPHRRVRRGPPRTGHASLARDRLRPDAARRAPRAGLGRDPDPVPAGARRRAARRPRLVRRRRHAAEHSDQAGARPRRRTSRRGRHRFGRGALEPVRPARHAAARLRRRRAARPAGNAGRPGRRGHAHPRQHQHVLRGSERRARSAATRAGGAPPTPRPSATARPGARSPIA